MLAVGEDGHLVEVFGEPGRRLGYVHEAVLDRRGLRVQSHDLVHCGLVAGDTVIPVDDQFLDQLGPRSLVLDQYLGSTVQALLLAHRALERWVFEPLPQQAKQIKLLAADTPGCTDTEVAELGRLVGGVPALHDAVEALRPVVLAIALEPLGLHQAAPQRRGGLLILAREIVFPERPPDAVEGVERLALGVQRLTLPAPEASRSPDRLDPVHLIDFSDRWKSAHLPWLLGEHMADEVVLVQPLHDNHDRAGAFVIEPAVQRVGEPVVGGFALRVRKCLVRLQWIIDQDDIGAAPGQHAAGGSGQPVSLAGGDDLLDSLTVRGQAGPEDPAIPWAHHDAAAIARELVSEILGVADAEDLRRGVMPKTPSRKGDRGHQRLKMPWRQVDDQSPDLAPPHLHQFGGDDLEVPVHRQIGLWVELLEAARREPREVAPQQDLVLSSGQSSHDHFSDCENRTRSCAMTFSSAVLKAAVSSEVGSACPSISRRRSSRILTARQSAMAD